MYDFVIWPTTLTFLKAALGLLSVVATWIIFIKAGRKGWESIIPFWNTYVLFKIADRKKWFWILLTVPFIWIIFGTINWYIASSAQFGAFSDFFTFSQMVTWFLSWIAIVGIIGAVITLAYGLTQKFGESVRFFIGMLIASPIFMAILAFGDYKYEEREFEKRYNRKFWVLIVVLFALFPTIIEGKERYNLYNGTATNELEWNYTGSQNVEIEIEDEENIDEEIKDEIVEDEEITEEIIKEEKPVKKIKEEEIELLRSATVKDTSEKGYDLIDASRPVEKTNVVWIDQYLSNYKGNVIYSEDLKRDVDEPYYHVYTKIKKRTMLIDEESNFIIYFGPDLIGNILDIVYNDINEITQIRVLTDEKSERVIFETNILPWYDCYHTAGREGNDKLWGLNEDYMFMVDGKYAELNGRSISLLPNIQNGNSQESLRTNLPCSVTPLEY